jgi:hypothetical protein
MTIMRVNSLIVLPTLEACRLMNLASDSVTQSWMRLETSCPFLIRLLDRFFVDGSCFGCSKIELM